MTSYEKIYDRFLQKITDYKMLDLSDTEIRQECVKWLSSAIAKFRRCKNDLSQRDNELETFTIDLLDIEIEILATLMVSEWLSPQLNSVLYTSQFFGGKEEKFFAQANQLDKLMTLKGNNDVEAKKLMRDYGYQNKLWNREET
ncbi:Uncharacterised protein [uncultured Clostridium sp.]|nr:Uncharacterised protein [uncultured Clostridium sp.]